MKDKTIFRGIWIVVIVIVLLIACAALSMMVSEGPESYSAHTGLLKVENYDNLYYDPVEKVVYILFNEMSGYRGYGYMSPYYASNGRPYLYDTQTKSLVKIEE